MEPFEYVVVLTSLILGLGIAQILTGVTDMVSAWRHVRFSLPHAIYILVIFFIHIQEWWINYEYQKSVTEWTLPTVMSILIFPILLFMQDRILFPTDLRNKETDLVKYFDEQWRWLYSIGALTVIVSIWHNVILSGFGVFEQVPQLAYLSVYLFFIIGNIKNQFYHTLFTLAQLALWLLYIAFFNSKLL